ncbi:MAG: NifU family protein [Pseudomonadota bacterium]
MSASPDHVKHPSSDLDSLLHEIDLLEGLVAAWDEQQRMTVGALRTAIDALNREAFRRLIQQVKQEPAALGALKDSLGDDVVYSVLRHHGLVRPSLEERLEAALETVRPQLATHGGDVELVAIDPPSAVTVRLVGACDGCPAAGLTLSEGVEKAIREHCPEITQVRKAKGGASASGSSNGEHVVSFVSPFARASDAGWTDAAKADELREGEILIKERDGHSLILSRFGSRVVCYENACAHLGMPMDMGEVRNGVLVCPHHAFEYSLQSGECLTAREVQLQTHAVRVLGDRVQVKFS